VTDAGVAKESRFPRDLTRFGVPTSRSRSRGPARSYPVPENRSQAARNQLRPADAQLLRGGVGTLKQAALDADHHSRGALPDLRSAALPSLSVQPPISGGKGLCLIDDLRAIKLGGEGVEFGPCHLG
jgi:hypothetical protein